MSRYEPKRFKASEWKENLRDLSLFFSQMESSERDKLLSDSQFKKTICDNITNVDYVGLFELMSETETIKFVDKEFISMMSNKGEKEFDYFYSRVDKYALGNIFLTEEGKDLIYPLSIYNYILPSWSVDIKERILEVAVEKGVDDATLAKITANIYYVQYSNDELIDYSSNEREIQLVSKFLQRDDVVLRYFKNYQLLSSLSPENRSEFYSNVSYQDLTLQDKKNLIDLLSYGYETKISSRILNDKEFLRDVASLKDEEKFRVARFMIKDLSEIACEDLDYEKSLLAKKYMINISTMNYNEIKGMDISLNEMMDVICYSYFRCPARDVLSKACLIKDAMNCFPDYLAKFSNDGEFLVNKLVEMLMQEKDIENYKRDKNHALINITEESYENLQDIISVLNTKSNWKEMFENAEKSARRQFEKSVNAGIYKLDEKNLKNNNLGLKIYDITKIPKFHLLVHKTNIYNTGSYQFPSVGGKGYVNTSMSILNNNHLGTFGDSHNSSYEMQANEIIYGYTNIDNEEIVHALPADSFTNLVGYKTESKKIFKRMESSYVPTYIGLNDFMANANDNPYAYNEVKLHKKPNNGNLVVPDYIVCRDKIKPLEVEISKRFNIPIVFINTKEVSKFPEGEYYKPILYKSKAALNGGVYLKNEYLEQ